MVNAEASMLLAFLVAGAFYKKTFYNEIFLWPETCFVLIADPGKKEILREGHSNISEDPNIRTFPNI